MHPETVEKIVSLAGIVQPKTIGRIIGTKGVVLNNFEKACKVRAVIFYNEDHDPQIKIKGSEFEVDNAVVAIYEMIVSIEMSSLMFALEVPCEVIGFIIGVGGRSIKEMMMSTNTKIIVTEKDRSHSFLEITGSYEAILDAICVIEKKLFKFNNIQFSSTESYVNDLTKKIISGDIVIS